MLPQNERYILRKVTNKKPQNGIFFQGNQPWKDLSFENKEHVYVVLKKIENFIHLWVIL